MPGAGVGERRLASNPRILGQARADLRARLEAKRPELEQATLARVYAISDPDEIADQAYAEGLRNTVAAAIDYAFDAIELGEERTPPPPTELLAQARVAARNDVGLDTVLRRYFTGYALLGEFLALEAESTPTGGAARSQLLQGQAAVFDRLVASVSAEYTREAESRPQSAEQRRADRVRRLLAGEHLDTSQLSYDLEGHHLGLVASGDGAAEALWEISRRLDCRPLLIRCDEQAAWCWFGTQRRLDPGDIEIDGSNQSPRLSIAVGEPGRDLAGWRLTHRQAAAALPVAVRRGDTIVRYSDVAMLASAIQDDVLVASLDQLFLAPLDESSDDKTKLLETLLTYFSVDHHISSTAAALGVARRTVSNRLRRIEERLGRPINDSVPELQIALRLFDLERNGRARVQSEPMSGAKGSNRKA